MACKIVVLNGPIEQAEIDAYLARACKLYGREPKELTIKVCGEEVELTYDYGVAPFHRIRRITGYLVGTLDRFNNAKRAEVGDRVKHDASI